MLVLFGAAFTSFLVTFYSIPFLQKAAHRLGVIDVPNGKLKQHKAPVPYFGGLGLYVGLLASLVLFFSFDVSFVLFFLGATFLLFLGLVDDVLVLGPRNKFLGQIIATLCFFRAGFYLKEAFFSSFLHIPLSFFWFISIINAFNLIDVSDGLAATVAFFATISFLIIATLFNLKAVALLLAALAGSLVAFLYYNWPSATIYLGDAGALFLGGIFATIPFFYNWGYYSATGYLSPLIILSIPLLELFFLIIIRTKKRVPIYYGSPHHFALFLKSKGWSSCNILFFIAFYATITMFVAISVALGHFSFWQVIMTGAVFFFLWCLVVFTSYF